MLVMKERQKKELDYFDQSTNSLRGNKNYLIWLYIDLSKYFFLLVHWLQCKKMIMIEDSERYRHMESLKYLFYLYLLFDCKYLLKVKILLCISINGLLMEDK